MILFKKTKLMYRAFVFTVFITAGFPFSLFGREAPDDSLRISEYSIYETFMPGDIVKFGVQSGFVYTGDLETGMDCGGRITQRFFHPFFTLTSQIHFWAASKKNLDMGVAGIEERVTYHIPIYKKLSGYAGFAFGYISVMEEKQVFNGAGYEEVDTRTNYFEPFVTFGIEYALERNRSVFIETKLGSTALSNEIHLLIGLNFYRKKDSDDKKDG